jgi:hypothetical protein
MNAASPDTWTVAEAKDKFSEVIEKARRQGPQTITGSKRRRGGRAIEQGGWHRALSVRRGGLEKWQDRLIAPLSHVAACGHPSRHFRNLSAQNRAADRSFVSFGQSTGLSWPSTSLMCRLV